MNQKFLITTLTLTAVLLAGLAGCSRSTATPEIPSAKPPSDQAGQLEPTEAAVLLAGLLNTPRELPPVVTGYRPGAGEEAALEDPVEISFDREMEKTSVETAFQMLAENGNQINGNFEWATPQSLRFHPSDRLLPGSTYKVNLLAGAAAQNGEKLENDVTFNVNTISHLQVVKVFPADGADQVSVSSQLTVMFNRPVAVLAISEEQQNLPQPLALDPPVEGKGDWVNTSVYVFTPDKPLNTGTNYTVTVAADLADAAGAKETALQKTYSWQFSTLPPGLSEIQVGSNTILPGQDYSPINVSLIPKIVLNFGQPMEAASTNKAFFLKEMDGTSVPLRYNWDKNALKLETAPLQVLKLGTTYQFGLTKDARAIDGGAFSEDWIHTFVTIPSPAIDFIGPGSDYQEGDTRQFIIDFASPMDIKSIENRVTFTPEVKDKSWFYDEADYSITYYGLLPSTEYTVKALAGMRDIYGNSINKDAASHFVTEPLNPSVTIEMPYNQTLMREGAPQSFYVNYTNIHSIDFKLYKLSEEEFLEYQENGLQSKGGIPDEDSIVWTYREKSQAEQNKQVFKSIAISGSNGKPVPAGFYLLTMDTPDITYDGKALDSRLLVIGSAHLTFKQSPANGLLWLTDLNSGQPIAGADLKVVDGTHKLVAQGKTGPDGLLKFDLPQLEDQSTWTQLYALSTSVDHFAFTGADMSSGVSPEDFGIWTSYYSLPQNAVAYIYTDRPLYRPNQPVYFKGIARMDQDMAYRLPTEKKVEVVISSYKEEVYREELALSEFGSFDGKLLLDGNAALGSYSIEVHFPGTKEIIGSGYFTVAEYRKPEFIVDVTAEPADVKVGGSLTANISAEYYSGGPLSGAEVSWNLQSDPGSFTPPENLSNYSFFDDSTLETEQTQKARAPREVTQGVAVTGEDGKLVLTLPADPQSIDPTRRLSFNVTVTDFAGTSVSGQAVVNAHRSSVYAGIRPESYVGSANEEQRFNLAAVDWNGRPVADQKMDVVISERQWYSVQQQDAQGVLRWISTVKDIPVTSISNILTDDQGLASAAFIPTKGVLYRARVTAYDREGKSSNATAYLWVAGTEYIPWKQANDRTFQLVTDKESYRPGDQAEFLIATPFQGEIYALITVERGLIRSQEVIRLTSNSTLYRLPITADMAPSVYVSAVAVKGIDDTNPRPDFKIGMARIDVSTEEQQLNVEVAPDKEKASPGEEVTYTVKVSGFDGSPARAEVSLGLADLSVLNMMDPNSGPILDYFYYRRSLQVSTALAMTSNLEEFNARLQEQIAEGAMAGSGGGKGEGIPGIPEVRRNFPDTAFWKADVVTGKDGQASVSVVLPDNLTTWRMDARAITLDTQAGQNKVDLVSTRPLLVRPQTPRFFVNGDQVVLSTAVHNNTGKDLTVEVSLDAQGVELTDPAVQTVKIENGKQAYIDWQTEVLADAERVDLVFSAAGGGYQDSSKPTLGTLEDQGIPVYRYEAPETVSTSGELSESGARTEVIRLPENMEISTAELDIEMAPSLAAGMRTGLTYLEQYPYECIEQTVSSFLPNVLSTRAMQTAGIENAELEENLRTRVNTALQKIYNRQNDDGGWGWWAGNKSQALTSAYVVLGLVEAQKAGYTVTQDVIQRGMLYLYWQSLELQKDRQTYAKYGKNTHAFLLYVLARSGDPAISQTVKLYDYWQSLPLDGKAFLARTLYEIDPADTRLKNMVSDLVDQAAISAGGAQWQNRSVDYWNWGTDTRTTAIVLDTLLQIDPENPILVQGVRWLMKNRVQGRWENTQETAWALMALTGWMEKSGELKGSFNYAAGLNGSQIGEGQAAPESIDQVNTLKVALADLLTGESNRLVFARTEGPGNLYYTANLNISLPVDNISAVNNGIGISRKYYTLADSKTPISSAQQGEIIQGRLTIVVPRDTHYLLVEDPLPAGLEGIDTSLKTSPQGEKPEYYDWADISTTGWGWWYFDHVELRDEKVVLSAEVLPAGTYTYTYLARAGTAGTFQVIPPTAREFYFPDVYGRGDGGRFEVKP